MVDFTCILSLTTCNFYICPGSSIWIECLASNQKVAGSSPARGISYFSPLMG